LNYMWVRICTLHNQHFARLRSKYIPQTSYLVLRKLSVYYYLCSPILRVHPQVLPSAECPLLVYSATTYFKINNTFIQSTCCSK
jgi:hypothetical protein